MKLSEAMMLGSTTCKMVPNDWNSCALGSAGNAIGIPVATEKQVLGSSQVCSDGRLRMIHIHEAWPWIMDGNKFFRADWMAGQEQVSGLEAIWSRFDILVCAGRMTLEQLVDYVRSIEPDCGECNKFECTCVKDEATVESTEAVAV